MKYEKMLKVVKEGKEVLYTYYTDKMYSTDFECDMYKVGIKTKGEKKEIFDFSPSFEEAKMLCDYLYERNTALEDLFSVSEEFVVMEVNIY